MNGHFNKLAAHGAWADALLWRLSQGAWQDHFEETRERLYHWHLTQRAFVDTLAPNEFNYRPVASFEDAPSLLAYAQETHEVWGEYLRRDIDVGVKVVIPWIADEGESPFQCSVREAITQSMMHAQHHRGQFATRLRDWGLEAESTDFIFWLKLGEPRPDWPSFS